MEPWEREHKSLFRVGGEAQTSRFTKGSRWFQGDPRPRLQPLVLEASGTSPGHWPGAHQAVEVFQSLRLLGEPVAMILETGSTVSLLPSWGLV